MYVFTPSTIPSNVFIIGAGGTGGRLIPMLSQFMRSITRGLNPTGWLESPKIWLIDDDIVEQKNILRQNFVERDVGKHKAMVLAERYSKAYGTNIIPITTRITTDGAPAFYKLVNDHLFIMNGNIDTVKFANIVGSSIVIICVDSVEARRDILNVFIPQGSTANGRGTTDAKTFFIDAGNEDNFGQVNFFTSTILTKHETTVKSKEIHKLCPVTANVDYIPLDFNYYKNLVDTPAQGSCADLNQTLAINAIMATTIMGVLQNYFYRKPMTYNALSISLDGGNATTYNTFNIFNNKGISPSEYSNYRNSSPQVKEKDGRTKRLTFASYIPLVSGEDTRNLLLKQMEEIIKEQERIRKKAEADEAKKIEDARIKEIAVRKRAQIRAAVEAARNPAVAVTVPEMVVVTEGSTQAPAPVDASTVPQLVARPRAARSVVELAVPSAWTEAMATT